MKTTIATLIKSVLLGLAVLVIVGAGQSSARADEVTITGSTTGTVTGVPPLTFTGNANFNGTTALGVGSLSGPNSLGSFFLSTSPLQPLAGTFTLNVTFAAPTGINGGQGTAYTATILGSVSPNINQGICAIGTIRQFDGRIDGRAGRSCGSRTRHACPTGNGIDWGSRKVAEQEESAGQKSDVIVVSGFQKIQAGGNQPSRPFVLERDRAERPANQN